MSWHAGDERLLSELLALDTTSPLESGTPGRLREAQRCYAEAAGKLGFTVLHHEPAPEAALAADLVPAPVRSVAARMGQEFLAAQPNLVLSLGAGQWARTVVLNCHLDTVAGTVPVRREDALIFGRGAVDDKGPGVALLAAVRTALDRFPPLPQRIRVLIHAVGGEEGGAMGVYGTRVVAGLGHTGRLTVVAEPTGDVYFDECTASMTLRLRAAGRGSIDDTPERGENATLLLGYLAVWISGAVAPAVRAAGGSTCLAGVHTGTEHNRVHGTGELLVNFAYGTHAVAARIEEIVEREVAAALAAFAAEFSVDHDTAVTARAAARMLHVEWLKRGLPTLRNRDPEMEALLCAAGFTRHDPQDPAGPRPFTCDAIWLGAPGGYTVVCGPGELARDNAHAEEEHVSLTDLARYTDRLADLLVRFADRATDSRPSPDSLE